MKKIYLLAMALSAGVCINSQAQNLVYPTTQTIGASAAINTVFGINAGINSNSFANSFFGYGAGQMTTSGHHNLFMGAWAGQYNTTGYWNLIVGQEAGQYLTTGSNNTIIGPAAGNNTGLLTGTGLTLIGNGAMAANGLTGATAIGQGAQVTASNAMVLGGTGTNAVNVGIGTTAPKSRLDVNGNIQISSAALPMGLINEVDASNPSTPIFNMSLNFRESTVNAASAGAGFRIDMRPNIPLFQWISRAAGESATLGGSALMALGSNGNLGIGTGNVIPSVRLHVVGDEFVTGKIGIGTNNFTQDATAKLIVNGKIVATEVEVKNVSADHVFENTYKLRSLAEVETYINQHKHLPDVPAASETEKGVKLAEFNTLLLQKIEELTLYIIKQDKKIETLKQKVSAKK